MATVNLDSLKPNSHEYKEKEKIKPVVRKDAVVKQKKTLGQTFKEHFLEDDVKDVKEYIIFDAIIPGIKNLCLDALEMFFFGGTGGRRRSGHRRDDDKVSYNSYYKSSYKRRSSRYSRDDDEDDDRDDRNVDYRDIVVKYSDDAKAVVDELRGRIDKYDQVTVAELLDSVGITGKYTDNNWGWTRKEDIGIRRVSNGYLIDVPEAKLLD